MARDKGDDAGKRRRGRGKDDEGPSEEELDWLADLRGGKDDRPLGDEPRSRRAGRPEEPPTGAIRSDPTATSMAPPAATGPAGGLGARPVRRTPPLPPVSPAGPTPPAGPPPAGPPPAPHSPPPTRGGFLRRTSPPPTAPPPPPPPPGPPLRSGGPRPMVDWSDLTGELPAATEPAPRGRGRGAELRTGDMRTGDMRTGDMRAGAPPAGWVGEPPRTSAVRPAGPAAPPPGLGGPVPGMGLPGPLPPGGPDLMTTGMIRRAELRKHLKIQQQLKSITLVLVVLLLLAAYPVYLFARSLAADPVLAGLDGLDLPEWSAYEHEDAWDGSRWCIGECRIRQRTWLSERGADETHPVYATALMGDGWRLLQESCPEPPDETSQVTCWKKDEYVLVLHVRPPLNCVVPPSREPVPGVTPTAGQDPVTRACPGALATVLVSYAIDPALQV